MEEVVDATVTIPLGQVTIREAAGLAEDGDLYYVQTMPPILATYHLAPSDYWALTVDEHSALLAHIEAHNG